MALSRKHNSFSNKQHLVSVQSLLDSTALFSQSKSFRDGGELHQQQRQNMLQTRDGVISLVDVCILRGSTCLHHLLSGVELG